MGVAKRNKQVKPDPESAKLTDGVLANYRRPEDLIAGECGRLPGPPRA
jgi:hypothetical protein